MECLNGSLGVNGNICGNGSQRSIHCGVVCGRSRHCGPGSGQGHASLRICGSLGSDSITGCVHPTSEHETVTGGNRQSADGQGVGSIDRRHGHGAAVGIQGNGNSLVSQVCDGIQNSLGHCINLSLLRSLQAGLNGSNCRVHSLNRLIGIHNGISGNCLLGLIHRGVVSLTVGPAGGHVDIFRGLQLGAVTYTLAVGIVPTAELITVTGGGGQLADLTNAVDNHTVHIQDTAIGIQINYNRLGNQVLNSLLNGVNLAVNSTLLVGRQGQIQTVQDLLQVVHALSLIEQVQVAGDLGNSHLHLGIVSLAVPDDATGLIVDLVLHAVSMNNVQLMVNNNIVVLIGAGNAVSLTGVQLPQRVLANENLGRFGLDGAGKDTNIHETAVLLDLQSSGGTVRRILSAIGVGNIIELFIEHKRHIVLNGQLCVRSNRHGSAGQHLEALLKFIAAFVQSVRNVAVHRIDEGAGGQLDALGNQGALHEVSAAMDVVVLDTVLIGTDQITAGCDANQAIAVIHLGEPGVVILIVGKHLDKAHQIAAAFDQHISLNIVAVILVQREDIDGIHSLGLGAAAPVTDNEQIANSTAVLDGQQALALDITEAVQSSAAGNNDAAPQIDLAIAAGDIAVGTGAAGTATDRVDQHTTLHGQGSAGRNGQFHIQIGIGTDAGISVDAGAVMVEKIVAIVDNTIAGIIVHTGNHQGHTRGDGEAAGRQRTAGDDGHLTVITGGIQGSLEIGVHCAIYLEGSQHIIGRYIQRELRYHAQDHRHCQQQRKASLFESIEHS